MSDAARPTPLGRLLLLLLRLYQQVVSPHCRRRCRYLPSCSAFAQVAIRRHGAAAGGMQIIGRLLRCGPWGGWGYDPVPLVSDRGSA